MNVSGYAKAKSMRVCQPFCLKARNSEANINFPRRTLLPNLIPEPTAEPYYS
jgi:hypothetical protein